MVFRKPPPGRELRHLPGGPNEETIMENKQMDRIDCFAAAALSGLLAGTSQGSRPALDNASRDSLIARVYELAEAMEQMRE